MTSDELSHVLGLTSGDEKVKDFLTRFGITKRPKLKRGEETAYLENEKLGLEITFRDERYLDVESVDYEEGDLVLSSLRMYGPDHDIFSCFDEDKLPLGLKFEYGFKEVEAKLKKKPAWQNKSLAKARWDLKGYCVFVTFGKKLRNTRIVSVQLPVA